MGKCINCGTELYGVDDDPNGEKNCVCARCRAEEDHDFDAEPNVTFDRCGNTIEIIPKPKGEAMPRKPEDKVRIATLEITVEYQSMPDASDIDEAIEKLKEMGHVTKATLRIHKETVQELV